MLSAGPLANTALPGNENSYIADEEMSRVFSGN